MNSLFGSSKLRPIALGMALALTLTLGGASSAIAEQYEGEALTYDGGNRIDIPFHWKIEHRARSPIDIFVHQGGTKEGKALLEALASAVGAGEIVQTIILAVPLPTLNLGATDNYITVGAPDGMTICKAGPIGNLEASHAAWSARIVRNPHENGLAHYTSIGTGPGRTHRIEGSFFVEFVKPVDGWEQKFGCMPRDKIVWNVRG